MAMGGVICLPGYGVAWSIGRALGESDLPDTDGLSLA
jgi:hypothetical protein